MKYAVMCKVYGSFFSGACKKELEKRFPGSKMQRAVKAEYKNIVLRAKEINNSRMLSAYMMGYISLPCAEKQD